MKYIEDHKVDVLADYQKILDRVAGSSAGSASQGRRHSSEVRQALQTAASAQENGDARIMADYDLAHTKRDAALVITKCPNRTLTFRSGIERKDETPEAQWRPRLNFAFGLKHSRGVGIFQIPLS